MIYSLIVPVFAAVLISVLLAIPVVLLAAPYYAGLALVRSAHVLADGYGLRRTTSHPAPVTPPPPKRTDDREPAHLHYLSNQAWLDAWHVAQLGGVELPAVARANWQKIVFHYFTRAPAPTPTTPTPTQPPQQHSAWEHAVGATLLLGMATGFLFAGAVLLLVALGTVAILGVLFGASIVARYLLRGIDTALLRLRGITLTCKHCAHRVPFPEYACPGCKIRHRDLRPGRYGLTHRTCRCGKRFPTLVVLKSYALEGFCPLCDRPLAKDTGASAEIVIPMFGASGAGKTQLMTVLTIAVEAMTTRGGGRFDFADETSRTWAVDARRVVGSGGPAPKTMTQAQPAVSMHIRPKKGGRRLVHIFDAAGEIFDEERRIEEQHQLTLAKTFVFVVDPLSIDRVWESVDAQHQDEWDGVRAHTEPKGVFERTVQTLHAMGVDTGKVRLVVVVSKSDLLRKAGRAALGTDGESTREWLTETLELDNMIRAMEHNFRDVSFFLTTALTDEPRTPTIALRRSSGVPSPTRVSACEGPRSR